MNTVESLDNDVRRRLELSQEDFAERIEQYTTDGWEAFFDDMMIQDATARNLQTLAESTQRLSDSLKSSHTDTLSSASPSGLC